MNETSESAAIMIASAAPIIDMNTNGSFHFMHINSYHPIIPHSYAQIAADAITIVTSANCTAIFVVATCAFP